MRKMYYTSYLLIGVCLIGIVLLVAAALTETKQTDRKGFVLLNEAMQDTITKLENGHRINDSVDHEFIDQSDDDLIDEMNEQRRYPERDKTNNVENDTGQVNDRSAPNQEDETKIDINRAGFTELQKLKGIGPSKANAIIMERETNGIFQSTDDLMRVKGIGKKMLDAIKEHIVARP